MASFRMGNDEIQVEIDEQASEIHSLKSLKTQLEYIWDGNPEYWKGRNPTLFPMVGKTWDGILHIHGKEYTTGNHGFCRNSKFTCIEHSDTKVVMELKDNEETLQQYPFHFTMQITYTIAGSSVHIAYAIRNTGDTVMPFNFGLHPAFRCPLEQGKTQKDYKLHFSSPETFTWNDTTLTNGTELELNEEELQKTVIIHRPNSTSVSLTDGTHGVKVDFSGYEWLAFWSPHAPFVCIEPWYSHTDFEKVEVPFEQREGTQFLEPDAVFNASYTVNLF